MTNNTRVKEPEIQDEILRLLANGQIWTNSRIKLALSKVLPLSLADRATANFRPNEEKWEEIVNNALSPSRRNYLSARGHVEAVRLGHHRITNAGRKRLKSDEIFAAAFHKVITSPEAKQFLHKWKAYLSQPPL